MRKIKIFLGAYVNFPNAQNVNCDYIAKYLDKEKFEVHTMYTYKMPIDKVAYESKGIRLHRLIHHRFIWWWSKYLTMLFGNYDIYYLPKMEPMDIAFAKRHPDKVFISSVEGVVGEQIPADDTNARDYYQKLMRNYFSISECIRESVKKHWRDDTPVFYLGIEQLGQDPDMKTQVKTIIWVGSVINRKRPNLLLQCAKAFPELHFIMIGDGDESKNIQERIKSEKLSNVEYLGRLPNRKVYEKMQQADLMLMTSDKEGLPKVIGEAMSQRIPVIYINECYNVDYVNDDLNGYAVPDVDQMIEKIQYLIDHPKKYQDMSEQAYQTIQAYTWNNLIKKYEMYFIEQYQKNQKSEANKR